MILAGIDRTYPVYVSAVLEGPGDLTLPEAVTPIFCGCFDWHSAVHGHFALARLCARFPRAPWAAAARATLDKRLTADAVKAEVAHLSARPKFELPYGLAWLLCLAAEAQALARAGDNGGRRWHAALAPLENLAAERIAGWAARLDYPVRTGQHDQSAFSLGLALDWARLCGRGDIAGKLAHRVRALYAADRDAPIAYEPSAYDFLSPILAEAEVMARILEPAEFSAWLAAFCPALDGGDLCALAAPVRAADRSDGKLVHFDGLNLSRAWMMRAISRALPESDPRRLRLSALAAVHARAGLSALASDHYAGTHWLGTFATLWLTS